MEVIMALLTPENMMKWILVATSVIGGFRVITTMTPNKVDDKIVNSLLKILNFASGAIGKNHVDHIDKPKIVPSKE